MERGERRLKLPFWPFREKPKEPSGPLAQGARAILSELLRVARSSPNNDWSKEWLKAWEQSELGQLCRMCEKKLLSDQQGPEDKLLKNLVNLSDLELLGFAYQCQTRSFGEAMLGGELVGEKAQLNAQKASQTAVTATAAAETESFVRLITWMARQSLCTDELVRRGQAMLPPLPSQVFADALVAYSAYLKRLATMVEPSSNADTVPHTVDFQSGLRLVFTPDRNDQGTQWHLSLSRPPDGPPSEEEIEAVLQAFFGGRANVTATEGVFQRNVRHFYKPDDPKAMRH